MSTKFSAFTSDLTRRPELKEGILSKIAALDLPNLWKVRESVSHDGTVTTFEPVVELSW